MTNRLLTAVLRYAQLGWFVLPLHGIVDGRCTCGRPDCKSPGKHPRTAHGVRDASTDLATIRRWWKTWPRANIGVATGAPSGFFTFDVDPRHGGEDSLESLIAKHGPLPDTRQQLTGGGGKHILFRHPGVPVPNMNGGSGFAPGVDLKGDGGYIVAAPSLHISGETYQWDGLVDSGIADPPRWVLDRIRQTPRPRSKTSTQEKIPEGKRHSALVSYAGKLRRVGCGSGEILSALLDFNRRHCAPPKSDAEVRKLAVDIAQRYEPVVSSEVDDEIEEQQERDAIQTEARERETEETYKSATPPDSFITRYVAYAKQRTDAPPAAHELLGVGLLSAMAGPNPRLPLATSVHGVTLGLWVLYVVNSTIGRKTTVIDTATDLIIEVLGPDAVLWWEGSPQGIIQRLQQRDGQPAIFARDEYSGLLAAMNRGGHMAGLPQLFIRAYDGKVLENIRTRKRNKETGQLDNDTDRVEEPYLVKLCASTWDAFTQRASIDNVLDGFLARFLVFTGATSPRPQQRATERLAAQRQALIKHGRDFHTKACALDMLDIEDATLEAAWQLEQEYATNAEKCSRPDAAGPALKRLADSVLKLAALLAIDESEFGEVPRVSTGHLHQASQMGQRWIKSTLALIDALGRTDFRQECEAVLSIIRAHPQGIKLSDLYRKRRNLKKRDFEGVLTALEAQEEIYRRQPEATGDRGRPPAIFYPARGAA